MPQKRASVACIPLAQDLSMHVLPFQGLRTRISSQIRWIPPGPCPEMTQCNLSWLLSLRYCTAEAGVAEDLTRVDPSEPGPVPETNSGALKRLGLNIGHIEPSGTHYWKF
eukprot:107800-Rhodomonas_salina.1